MQLIKKPVPLVIASILMVLLGLARGFGGVVLLLHGKAALSEIIADESAITCVSVGLILIGIFEIISAVGVFYLKRKYWLLGIIVTILFVINGAVNGYFLFGKPGDSGTIVNIIVALIIITFLIFGRKSLKN